MRTVQLRGSALPLLVRTLEGEVGPLDVRATGDGNFLAFPEGGGPPIFVARVDGGLLATLLLEEA